MEIVSREGSRLLIRFDAGEEVLGGLSSLCEQEGIAGGTFGAIGTAAAVTLSFYDLAAKAYRDTDIRERTEIVSLNGNVARKDGAPFVHAHGSFAGPDLLPRGGHVKRLVTDATCELWLDPLPHPARREPDSATGLNLLRTG